MNQADFILAKEVPACYSVCGRTLDRHGVPCFRLTPRGKKLYRRADIEAALSRHVSTVGMEKVQLDMVVNTTVDEVLKELCLS